MKPIQNALFVCIMMLSIFSSCEKDDSARYVGKFFIGRTYTYKDSTTIYDEKDVDFTKKMVSTYSLTFITTTKIVRYYKVEKPSVIMKEELDTLIKNTRHLSDYYDEALASKEVQIDYYEKDNTFIVRSWKNSFNCRFYDEHNLFVVDHELPFSGALGNAFTLTDL